MGKRIRHLEFYGYTDQNVFSGPNGVNLSDIRETNREQDESINKLIEALDGKADKAYVDDLKEKVKKRFENQYNFNQKVVESANELFDNVDAISGNVISLTEKYEELSGKVNSDIEELASYKETTDSRLDEIEKDYTTSGYTYSKEEIDDTFLTKEEAETLLSDEDMKTLLDKISGMTENMEELIEGLEIHKYATNERVDELDTKVDDHIEECNSEISKLNDKIDSLDETLNGLDGKATKEELTEAFDKVDGELKKLDAKKADKSYVDATKAEIDSDLSIEKQERISCDKILKNKILDVIKDTEAINANIRDISSNTVSLEDALGREAKDRENADLSLVGTSDDESTSNTIYGAKKYADKMSTDALNKAKAYTDSSLEGFDARIGNAVDKIETDLSALASIEYVDGRVSDMRDSLLDRVKTNVTKKVEELKSADDALDLKIANLETRVNDNDITDVRKRITMITTYTEYDPENYTPYGNGVLDVLHREFHKLKNRFDEEQVGNAKELVNAETARAQEVETKLWEGVNGETYRAQEVETKLWGAINDEAANRGTVETQIWGAINTEVTNRGVAESQLWEVINNLKARIEELERR